MDVASESSMAKKPQDTIILLVDDDETSLLISEATLHSIGYEFVLKARNVKEARAYLSVIHFDLIITDWDMPSYSGIDLIMHVRSCPPDADTQNNRATPIIILSSRDAASDAREAAEAGSNAYLHKPVAPEVLKATMEALLHR